MKNSNFNLAEEIGKLNELRKSGALTDEEFAEQKAKLMGPDKGNGSPQQHTGSEGNTGAGIGPVTNNRGETFPTRKIANAVTILREAGVKERDIAAPAQKLAWKMGQPLPPGPYMFAEPGVALLIFALIGSLFATLMAIFSSFTGGDVSIWSFLFMAVAFGGLMSIAYIVIGSNMRGKHGLPEWHEIPG